MYGWDSVARDTVRVWLIPSCLPAPVLARLEEVLDDDERRRAEALRHPTDRQQFLAVHGTVRLVLARALGVPAGEIVWRRGRYGKPEVDLGPGCAPAPPLAVAPPVAPSPPLAPLAGSVSVGAGVHMNLSHSGGLAALAITRGRPVGVDLQRISPQMDAGRLASRYYPPAEARFVAAGVTPVARADRFVRLWTRKEACVKASGGRLSMGLRLPVRGSGRAGGAARSAAEILITDPGGPLPGPYLVRDVPAPRGFRAAVAIEGAHAYPVSRRWCRVEELIGT
jgi:4'-phosphopantetheinyl transferase